VVEFVIPSSCNCRLEWGDRVTSACRLQQGALGYRSGIDLGEFLQLSINPRSGGVPTAIDQSGNEYWAPAATIFPRTEASHVLDER
jgi:hypothetical protein